MLSRVSEFSKKTSVLLFFAGFGLLLCNPAYADNVNYNVTIHPSLRLVISSNDITLNLDPNTKPFDSKNFSVEVSTNNPTGYQLIMSAASTSLNRDSSQDGQTATIDTLAAKNGGYTEDNFTVNKWGYKKGDTNYVPFSSGTVLMSSGTTTYDDSVELTFASKIDHTQLAGAYSATVTFNTIMNLMIPYIQNLDPAYCTATPAPVIDKRDGQEYYVARLNDGNCWMLDNLRLDPTEVSLDLLKNNTNATDESLTYLKNGGGSSPYPATGIIAKGQAGGTWANSYNVPYVAVSGAENGGWDKNTVASVKYGTGSGKIGVYYNYCAASAGSYCYAGGAGSGNASYDICPAGWQLPAGNTALGSYSYLYTTSYSSTISNFQTALSLVLSGYFGGGNASEQGTGSRYWASTSATTSNMRSLNASATTINAQNTASRFYGFSVRCILK